MEEFIYLIEQEFEREEGQNSKTPALDDGFAELMKKTLCYEDYNHYIKHEDSLNTYWGEREIRLIEFVLKFYKKLFD